MKLAELLIERKAAKERIGELQNRLLEDVVVQEGDEPVENPELTMREIHETAERFRKIIVAINNTNINTKTPDGNLMEFIAKRDILKMQIGIYERVLAGKQSESLWRMGKSEIKHVRTMDFKKLRKDLDTMYKSLRELDTEIQSLNWLTEVDEEITSGI